MFTEEENKRNRAILLMERITADMAELKSLTHLQVPNTPTPQLKALKRMSSSELDNLCVGDKILIGPITGIVASKNNESKTLSIITEHVLCITPWDVNRLGAASITDGEKICNSLVYHKESTEYATSFIKDQCSLLTFHMREHITSTWFRYIGDGFYIPTKEQLEDGLEYFTDGISRKCTDTDGRPCGYWSSSAYSSSYVWNVTTIGSLDYSRPSLARGFRPAIDIHW